MSSGNFVTVSYNASYAATIHPIRIQPETSAAAIGATDNNPVTDAPTNPISAQVSKSTRSLGLHARQVFAKVDGVPPTGYSTNARVRIPALTAAFYGAAVKGVTMTYLGADWIVTGRRAEVVR